jgi:hypothetical protein
VLCFEEEDALTAFFFLSICRSLKEENKFDQIFFSSLLRLLAKALLAFLGDYCSATHHYQSLVKKIHAISYIVKRK